ncbi:MAG: peptidase, partial [Planctomycetes bacterium]|nr:peptidase [Planctomycetota bacterium]
QQAVKDLRKFRDPLEASFFAEQAAIDREAQKLWQQDPAEAQRFLTEYTKKSMQITVKMYQNLRNVLITKYTNNKLGG